jgi:hypothetical protein
MMNRVPCGEEKSIFENCLRCALYIILLSLELSLFFFFVIDRPSNDFDFVLLEQLLDELHLVAIFVVGFLELHFILFLIK